MTIMRGMKKALILQDELQSGFSSFQIMKDVHDMSLLKKNYHMNSHNNNSNYIQSLSPLILRKKSFFFRNVTLHVLIFIKVLYLICWKIFILIKYIKPNDNCYSHNSQGVSNNNLYACTAIWTLITKDPLLLYFFLP